MASDQAMALERDRVLGDSKDPEMLSVREAKRGEVLPRVIRNDKKLGAKEVTKFETEFLLVEVNTGRPVSVRGYVGRDVCVPFLFLFCFWCLVFGTRSLFLCLPVWVRVVMYDLMPMFRLCPEWRRSHVPTL